MVRCLASSAQDAALTSESRMRGSLLGSLVADAVKIRKFYGRIDRYFAPGEKTGGETHGIGWGARNFHNGNGVGPAKRAGEQTDYGDYSLLLAEHLAATADSAPSAMDLAA